MRERGLPLSPMMARATVRAVSPKTMTRRIVKPQPTIDAQGNFCWNGWNFGQSASGTPLVQAIASPIPSSKTKSVHCPYGAPGDRLWGREAYRTLAKYDNLPPREVPTTAPIWYEADGKAPPEFGRYRHGRFMMRWMSRIIREVTSIAVERLHDISKVDSLREGIEVDHHVVVGAHCAGGRHSEITEPRYFIPGMYDECDEPTQDDPKPGFESGESAFFRLWEILHGPGSVEADPWLWAIGFGPVPAL